MNYHSTSKNINSIIDHSPHNLLKLLTQGSTPFLFPQLFQISLFLLFIMRIDCEENFRCQKFIKFPSPLTDLKQYFQLKFNRQNFMEHTIINQLNSWLQRDLSRFIFDNCIWIVEENRLIQVRFKTWIIFIFKGYFLF